MVVLEAAAITAGGIAAYKGGKAAVTETSKMIKTKIKLSNQEKERQEQFESRKKERKERFSKVNEYRNSMKDVNVKGEGVALPNFSWGKSTDGSISASSISSRIGSKLPSSATRSHHDHSNSGTCWEKQSSSSKSWFS